MDYAEIEMLVGILRDSRLSEMEIRQGDRALRLRRAPARVAPIASRVPASSLPADNDAAVYANENGHSNGAELAVAPLPATVKVTAGLVGVFHPLREPVGEDTVVVERQVLGQIESMRLMNDCLAPAAGRIVAVHVEEEQPVQYGQTLFEIVPEDV